MMALVEQTVRRDDAVEILQRRPPRGGKVLLKIFGDILDDILLERRWRSVGLATNGIAGRLHPLRNVWWQVLCIFRRQSLAAGETVKLSSFGSFIVRSKGERVGRNPKTGVEVPIDPRRVMVFKPSNVLKAHINGETFEGED